ncbi:MAG TPA: site-2 protease family protein [Candidatus Paceibacterota bacterium]
MDTFFFLIILIFSVMLHELAHGYTADFLGDPTARMQGRLTLNPLKHIDPMGSIILPLLLKLSGSPILIGYAKPVPYNPYNLRGKYAEGLVAAAGPATNIALAVIFGLVVRYLSAGVPLDQLPPLVMAFGSIAFINMLLALFNLIPIPPLDGSKVLSSVLPGVVGVEYNRFRARFERLGVLSGTLVILIVFYLLAPMFSSVLEALFRALTGL